MKILTTVKTISILSGLLGSIAALFICAQSIGLGRQAGIFEAKNQQITMFGDQGLTIFEDMALRYCLISICFILSIAVSHLSSISYLKVIAIIPLLVIVIQLKILIVQKTEVFENGWQFLSWLRITYNMDFAFFAAVILLISVQLFLIQFNYRVSGQKDLKLK